MGNRIGSITFGGLSSGLQTDQLISKLLEIERQPIQQIEARRGSFNTQLEIFRDLNTKTSRLRDLLRDLDNRSLLGSGPSADEEFSRFAATSSDPDVATATVDGTAAGGVFNVRVTQLASATRLVSDQGYASLTNTVGTGSFTIKVGTTTYPPITIDGTNNTVQGFINAINDSGADVTAFVLNDGSATPFHIVIQGNETGASNAVTLTNGLAGGNPVSPSFTQSQAALNAELVLDPDEDGDGVTVQSASNTFTDLLSGVTLQVRGTNDPLDESDHLQISLEPDDDGTVAAISEVVKAFNEIVSAVNDQFKIDPTTNRGGPLIGDSTLSSLQQRLSLVIAREIGTGSVTQASQIGIELDSKGLLALDESKLRAKLASDPESVATFFSGADSLADRLRNVTDAFVRPVDGLLVTRIEGTSRVLSDLAEQIAAAEKRLTVVEDSLVRQFAALENVISDIRLQGNFLGNFLLQNQGR